MVARSVAAGCRTDALRGSPGGRTDPARADPAPGRADLGTGDMPHCPVHTRYTGRRGRQRPVTYVDSGQRGGQGQAVRQ